MLRGIKRVQGVHKRPRLPITLDHLKIFRLCLPPTSFDNRMLWAAMSVAFFGFLRIGEITCNSLFSENIHLTWDDIQFSPLHAPTSVSINIKASKTDPFRSGATIKIGSCLSPLCPVAALHQYSQATTKQNLAPFSSIKVENICLVKDSLRKFAPSYLMRASTAVFMLGIRSGLGPQPEQQKLTFPNGWSRLLDAGPAIVTRGTSRHHQLHFWIKCPVV